MNTSVKKLCTVPTIAPILLFQFADNSTPHEPIQTYFQQLKSKLTGRHWSGTVVCLASFISDSIVIYNVRKQQVIHKHTFPSYVRSITQVGEKIFIVTHGVIPSDFALYSLDLDTKKDKMEYWGNTAIHYFCPLRDGRVVIGTDTELIVKDESRILNKIQLLSPKIIIQLQNGNVVVGSETCTLTEYNEQFQQLQQRLFSLSFTDKDTEIQTNQDNAEVQMRLAFHNYTILQDRKHLAGFKNLLLTVTGPYAAKIEHENAVYSLAEVEPGILVYEENFSLCFYDVYSKARTGVPLRCPGTILCYIKN